MGIVNYNAGLKYFDVIDGTVTVADLIAAKGGLVAADEWVFVSGAARQIVEQSFSLRSFYFGDNYDGTAAVKRGDLTVNAGTTITFGANTNHEGFSGEGALNVLTFNGAADNRITVTCTNLQKCSQQNIYLSEFNAQYTDFHRLLWFYVGRDIRFTHCLLKDFSRAIYIALHNGTIQNSDWDGLVIEAATVSSVGEVTSTVPVTWGDFFKTNEVRMVGGAGAYNQFSLRYGDDAAESRYISYRQNLYSIKAAPAWSSDIGIAALATNGNLTLSASWGSAAHATGDTVEYNLYIREGVAPDSFGRTSAYYLGSTRCLAAIIAATPDGAALVAGITYYVIVRAQTLDSGEDDNVEVLSAEAASNSAEIQKLKNTINLLRVGVKA